MIGALSAVDIRDILADVGADLREHVEELRELDAMLGDGDLGITVQLASGALAQAPPPQSEDVGLFLAGLGMAINKVSPSTFGTLLASAFMGAGGAVHGRSEVTLADLPAIGSGAVEAIKKRGKAEVGDKTMLDALAPAVEALTAELQASSAGEGIAAAAVRASERGLEATAGMRAKFGRASWRGEESIGRRDAGATAMHHLVRSLARRLEERVS
jgi:phosphoenolpyruvate---glycerone phosphotransferase subunit DhaL